MLSGVLACALAWAAEAAGAQVAATGDAQRGYQLLLQRQESGCVLCHQIPGLPVGGELGPSLAGLPARASAQAVRDRIADPRRFNPVTLMPPYGSLIGLHNVAQAYQGKTILSAQGLDDIVAYLMRSEGAPP